MSFFNFVGKVAASVVNGSEVVANKVAETSTNVALGSISKAGELSKTLPTNMVLVGKTAELTWKIGQVEGINNRKTAEKTIKGLDSQIAKLDKLLGNDTSSKGKSIREQLAESYTANRK